MATFCIPNAPGVPGLSGQPPYWLPGGTYPQRTELDDPRWRGAYRRNFNGDVVFRAVYDIDGDDKSLYLSWHSLFVPELDDADDRLYVGFQPGAGGTALVIRLQVHGTPGSETAANVQVVDAFTNTGPGGAWQSVADPAWIDQNTRMWMTPGAGTSGSFAVQMRVPITTSGGVTNAAGPQIGDDPRIWAFVTGGAGGSLIEVFESPSLGTTALDLADDAYPDPAGWDRLSTVPGDALCPTTGGIALSSTDVGTTNTPNSRILFDPDVPVGSRPVNTFFARPRNYTPGSIGAGAISGRFRIANWGSIADPNAAWVDIPGGGAVSSLDAIGAIPAGSAPPATNPIRFDWRLTDADIATFITGSTTHKCILVELDGPNLTFFNESVYRNMDFGEASTFRREAEISVRGLGPGPGGAVRRDVYLAVETVNMPAVVTPGQEPSDVVDLPAGPSGQPGGGMSTHGNPKPDQPRRVSRKEALALAKRGGLTEEEIQTFMPTYRVHVYYDTGRRLAGRPVLRPQTYFGYFIEHEGALTGWQQQLHAPPDAQLQQIREGFYRITVPADGATTVTSVIEARERTPGQDAEGCLAAILRLFKR